MSNSNKVWDLVIKPDAFMVWGVWADGVLRNITVDSSSNPDISSFNGVALFKSRDDARLFARALRKQYNEDLEDEDNG